MTVDLSQPMVNFEATVSFSTSEFSSVADLVGGTLSGLITSTSYGSTQITFQSAATSSGPFYQLRNNLNSAISITTSSSGYHYVLDPADFASVRYLKCVAPATQTDETFTLVIRPVL